jgi:hypothetical protein
MRIPCTSCGGSGEGINGNACNNCHGSGSEPHL